MKTIGSKIAMCRNGQRWTQYKLASELDITQSQLSDIENDKISPRWDMINKIAETMEVPVLSLLPVAGNTDSRELELMTALLKSKE